MKRLSLLAAVLAACLLALAGCGGHKTVTTTSTTTTTSTVTVAKASPTSQVAKAAQNALSPTACPAGQAFIGCNTPVQAGTASALSPGVISSFSVARQRIFPDVSNWQGHPDWAAAKPSIAGAGIKAGESHSEDIDFAWNVAQLKKLALPWVPYWFVRPIDCATEGNAIVSVIRSVGGLTSGPVVLDEEEPGLAGYASCLDRIVFGAFHRHAVIYTAPGTWSGGSTAGLGLWQAEYGPRLHPAWKPVLAWQCTDGVFGCVRSIPGIAGGKPGDVSVDMGLLELQPKAADPYPKASRTVRYFGRRPHRDHAQEHRTLLVDRAKDCRTARKHPGLAVCQSTRRHEQLLEHRIWVIATHHGRLKAGHRDWRFARGVRFQYLSRQLAQR